MTALSDIARAAPASAAGIGYIRRRGDGQAHPLLLLHGIGSHARSFAPLIDALPDGVDAVAWDAPGYGASQPLPEASPRPDDYAEALLRMMDALDLSCVVLVGHSLGCLFAARFAAQHPDRVAALALLSPALGYRVAPGEPLPQAVQARIDDLDTLGAEAFAAARAARLVHQPERKPQVLAGVREAMAAVNPQGYAQAVRALGAGDLLADAAAIIVPTLVAVGAEDVVTPPANARRVHDALTDPVGCHDIADAGHALAQENPAAVAGLLMPLIGAQR